MDMEDVRRSPPGRTHSPARGDAMAATRPSPAVPPHPALAPSLPRTPPPALPFHEDGLLGPAGLPGLAPPPLAPRPAPPSAGAPRPLPELGGPPGGPGAGGRRRPPAARAAPRLALRPSAARAPPPPPPLPSPLARRGPAERAFLQGQVWAEARRRATRERRRRGAGDVILRTERDAPIDLGAVLADADVDEDGSLLFFPDGVPLIEDGGDGDVAGGVTARGGAPSPDDAALSRVASGASLLPASRGRRKVALRPKMTNPEEEVASLDVHSGTVEQGSGKVNEASLGRSDASAAPSFLEAMTEGKTAPRKTAHRDGPGPGVLETPSKATPARDDTSAECDTSQTPASKEGAPSKATALLQSGACRTPRNFEFASPCRFSLFRHNTPAASQPVGAPSPKEACETPCKFTASRDDTTLTSTPRLAWLSGEGVPSGTTKLDDASTWEAPQAPLFKEYAPSKTVLPAVATTQVDLGVCSTPRHFATPVSAATERWPAPAPREVVLTESTSPAGAWDTPATLVASPDDAARAPPPLRARPPKEVPPATLGACRTPRHCATPCRPSIGHDDSALSERWRAPAPREFVLTEIASPGGAASGACETPAKLAAPRDAAALMPPPLRAPPSEEVPSATLPPDGAGAWRTPRSPATREEAPAAGPRPHGRWPLPRPPPQPVVSASHTPKRSRQRPGHPLPKLPKLDASCWAGAAFTPAREERVGVVLPDRLWAPTSFEEGRGLEGHGDPITTP